MEFTWELVFSGTDNYNPYTFKSTKTLKKQDAAITVTPYGDDVITYGDEPYVRFRVSAPYDLSDIINGLKVYDYKSDKTTKYSEDELMFDVEEGTGAFICRLDNPVAGEHYIIFEYAGNDIYAAENVEQKLTVNKRPVTVSVTNTEFTYGDDVKLNLKLGGNVYGETSNVDIEVSLEKPGKRITYNKDNISLPGTYNVDFLSGGTEKIPAGEYTVTVKVTHTDENSNYLNFNETLTGTTVTVNKAQPKQEFYYFRQYYTYDGLEKVPRVVKSEATAGAVTAIKIKPEGKTDYITSPIDAGKYGVYIDTAETDNYYAGEDLYIGDM